MKFKSKKIGLVVLAAILASSVVSVIVTPVGAQPEEVWNVTWGGTGADRVRAIATTEDSVYLAGTSVFTNTTSSDAFLNKYDCDGNLLWNITWNTSLYDEAYATAATEDCVYVAGDTASSNVSDSDARLNKYDCDGNLLWNITWGGPGSYSATAAATSGDSVYVAGSGGHIGGRHAFINKYDGDGNLIWNRTCGSAEGKATATGDNAVYLAGETACTDGICAFLNKYDGDGNLIWNITCGRETLGWATATGDNAVYLAGYTLDHGAYLNKYDSTDGNLLWNITWSGAGGALGYATAASGDCVYLAGPDTPTDCDFCNTFLNKYNSTDGSLLWNTTWGKTGWYSGQAIATIGDSVYLTGTTSSGSSESHNFSVDTFLVKISEPTPTPKITSTPSENVRGECKTLWYFDEQSVKCQQKQFCGLYMYKGLRTFEAEEECRAALEKYLREEQKETPTSSPTQIPTQTPTPTPPGFDAIFAITGLLAVAFLVLRRRRH